MSLVFSARTVTARKQHQCFACLGTISKGDMYVGYPGKNEDGEFKTIHLCVECSFLLNYKTGDFQNTIRPGEFSELKIANCLRKKRTEYRQDPAKAIAAVIEKLSQMEPAPPKPCNQIVVKASELERKIFHLPESRYKVEQFAKGASLIVKAGVNGESRIATIKGAWSTDGSGFGCNKRQVAVLVA